MLHVLGIDAGGTKTVCQLADEHGTVVAEARRAARTCRRPASSRSRRSCTRSSTTRSAIADSSPRRSASGMAGVDRPDDAATVRAILRRIGHGARLLVVNDALIALEAGAAGRAGRRRHRRHRIDLRTAATRRARPRAPAAGDTSSATRAAATGSAAPRCAPSSAPADGRGPATSLTRCCCEHFGVRRPQDLIHEIYHAQLRPTAIAALAALRPGRGLAGRPGRRSASSRAAADELAAAAPVSRAAGSTCREPFPFILAGGIFRAVPVARAGTRPAAAGRVRRRRRVQLLEREPAPAPSRSRCRKRAACGRSRVQSRLMPAT